MKVSCRFTVFGTIDLGEDVASQKEAEKLLETKPLDYHEVVLEKHTLTFETFERIVED